MMQASTFTMTLEEAYMLTPSVKHFVFHSDLPISYLPGQFITIHIQHQDKMLKRSYSIATPPQQTSSNHTIIELAATYVENGPGTACLFHLKPGDKLETSGPFGRLTLKDSDPQRYILVATSTGITPYRAMLPALQYRLDINPSLQVIILQGVRTANDLLYHQEFLHFAHKNPGRCLYRAQLSQAIQSNVDAQEHLGYVQTSFDALRLNPESDIVYLCGNPVMVDESFMALKEKGFAIQNIVREKYISR